MGFTRGDIRRATAEIGFPLPINSNSREDAPLWSREEVESWWATRWRAYLRSANEAVS
jgi:hypothetical protein